ADPGARRPALARADAHQDAGRGLPGRGSADPARPVGDRPADRGAGAGRPGPADRYRGLRGVEGPRDARFGLTPGRFSLAVRPRGVPGLALAPCGLALPWSLGLPLAPALARVEAAMRVLAFRPVLGSDSPNGARAEPW